MNTHERLHALSKDLVDIIAKSEEGREKLREVLLTLMEDIDDAKNRYPIPADMRELIDLAIAKLRSAGIPLQEINTLRTRIVDRGGWQDLPESYADEPDADDVG